MKRTYTFNFGGEERAIYYGDFPTVGPCSVCPMKDGCADRQSKRRALRGACLVHMKDDENK